ncbi:MAG: DNA mismatch endonuclease Vsr [Lentisphaeria bacterium]|nr:DNA mismatch endonuclease Vsr [Lentisphaeria bacterium]
MDTISKDRRSWNMQRIRSKNTFPELIVRSFLHRNGFRFRICDSRLPGKPDIVLKMYNLIIQVRGCFWHQHPDCRRATIPSSNTEYWHPKLQRNIERDQQTDCKLTALGWKVVVIWECEVKNGNFKQILAQQLPSQWNQAEKE